MQPSGDGAKILFGVGVKWTGVCFSNCRHAHGFSPCIVMLFGLPILPLFPLYKIACAVNWLVMKGDESRHGLFAIPRSESGSGSQRIYILQVARRAVSVCHAPRCLLLYSPGPSN